MNPLSVAIVQSGLVDNDMVKEMKRWGMPLELPDELPPAPKNLNELDELLERALQHEGLVTVRETDLQMLQSFLTQQKKGTLHVVIGEESADVPVNYVRNPSNKFEYVIPFTAESIASEMTNGETYLVPADDDYGFKVYFSDVRDVFFGETKAFMVCLASQVERVQYLPAEEGSDAEQLP